MSEESVQHDENVVIFCQENYTATGSQMTKCQCLISNACVLNPSIYCNPNTCALPYIIENSASQPDEVQQLRIVEFTCSSGFAASTAISRCLCGQHAGGVCHLTAAVACLRLHVALIRILLLFCTEVLKKQTLCTDKHWFQYANLDTSCIQPTCWPRAAV